MLYPIAWRRNITSKIDRFLDIKPIPDTYFLGSDRSTMYLLMFGYFWREKKKKQYRR